MMIDPTTAQEHIIYDGHDIVGGSATAEETPYQHIDTPEQEHLAETVDAAVPLMSATSNQLTLLFQGEVYVFDSVTPEKVQAVLLLLGGCEVPTGVGGLVPSHQDNRGLDEVLRRSNIPAKRIASLIRFREKRKERCFDKKIRYTVRKEVALRMQRRKGQFAGKANPLEGASTSSCGDPSQSTSQDDAPQESQCQNCGISEKMTPAMRRGPAGPRSLCNACGLMWANKGTLRSLSRTPKMDISSPAHLHEHSVPVNSHIANDNKTLVTSGNRDSSISTNELEIGGIPIDVHQEMDVDFKTSL